MNDDLPADLAAVRGEVIDRYSGYARQALQGERPLDGEANGFEDGCFGAAAYDPADVPESALRASLGCGNPLAVAELRPGDVVLDLGSGGGLDVLLAARRVEPGGSVYGLDASRDMITLARANAEAAGTDNVQFLHGTIEDIPLSRDHVDVVISNCVINLSADKPRVLAETFRVLKPGGRLGISDVIAEEGLDSAQRRAAEQRVGCSSGTLTASEYRTLLSRSGFVEPIVTLTTNAGGGLSSANIQASKPG
ncbi:MAG: methyltransferase domain-containing protein [Pseudonocardiales bacterium]